MIIDFHTHIFPPEVIERRQDFARRDRAFSLLYGDPKARMVTAEGQVETMDQDGVDRAVVCGFPWTDPGLSRMANDYLLDAQEGHPDRLVSFHTPSLAGGDGTVQGALDGLDRGMKGIGEVACYTDQMTDGDWSHLKALGELCLERGVPLLLHVNESVGHAYPGKADMRIRDVWKFASDHPELKLVLAHWGGGLFFYELMKSVGRTVGSLYYDTAASPFLYLPSIYRIAVEIIGPERILFGSDYPLIRPSRYFDEIGKSGLSKAAISRILGENAFKLLGE